MSIGWKEIDLLGDERLDAQHKQLFNLARQILAAEGVAVVTELAAQLYTHANIHLENEEGLMRQYNYPSLESHIASHRWLLGRLNSLNQHLGAGQLDKASMDALMIDWTLFHIPLDDARFVAYLKSSA